MVYAVVEISCMPNGDESYPVPTKFRLCKIFGSVDEAKQTFTDDLFYAPDSEYVGQDIYYVLWNTDEELNLDRSIVRDNTLSNCGMWLDAEYRVWGDTADMEVTLQPSKRVRERSKKHTGKNATKPHHTDTNDSDNEYTSEQPLSRALSSTTHGASVRNSGAPWRRYM